MQRLWPQPNFENIPKSLLVLGCLYFLYEAALQFLFLVLPVGPVALSPAEEAPLLRDARGLALGFLYLGAFFLYLLAWQPTHLGPFLSVLLVAKATFLVLWYTPAPLEVNVLFAAVPLALLGALVFLAFRFQRPRRGAP